MITKSVYVLEAKCDGRHNRFMVPRLRAEGTDLGKAKLAGRMLGWKFHKGSNFGKLSCPGCVKSGEAMRTAAPATKELFE